MKSMFCSQTFLPKEEIFFYDVLHTEYITHSTWIEPYCLFTKLVLHGVALCIKCKGFTGLLRVTKDAMHI